MGRSGRTAKRRRKQEGNGKDLLHTNSGGTNGGPLCVVPASMGLCCLHQHCLFK